MKILVINCGSSSIKFQLFDTDLEKIKNSTDSEIASGLIEKIGLSSSIISFQVSGRQSCKFSDEILEHRAAIKKMMEILLDREIGCIKDKSEIKAVGHRIVHGGEKFFDSVLITAEVLKEIENCIEFAPLHNPHNIRGYLMAKEFLPDIPHVAVFDTGFHSKMPSVAYMYGLPYSIYSLHKIRKYGFHGISHRYVSYRMAQITDADRYGVNTISCHLGNGCSVAAINRGVSIDTSMGFTPVEGLMMGTRCGDMDPSVIIHIMGKEELSLHEANTLLNKHSGLYGISGVSNDMREILTEMKKGSERATLAFSMFCYRLKKYIGSYMAVLNRTDYIIFTAGIGENSPDVRSAALSGMGCLGVELDEELNKSMVLGKEGKISTPDSRVQVFVVPTNEGLVIARDTFRSLDNNSN